MKKLILLSVITLTLITTPFLTHAQLWSVGLKGGTTLSNYKAKTPWKEASNLGFHFGATAFKQTKKNWGFMLELQYIQKGYYHKVCNEIYDQLEATYLEVPVMADYAFLIPSLKNFKAHVNLGIYGAYWLSGKYKMQGFDTDSEDYDFTQSNASRFDFGPNVGGRIEYILKKGSVNLDFRYEIGVVDLEKRVNDNTSNTNRSFIVGISYLKLLGK